MNRGELRTAVQQRIEVAGGAPYADSQIHDALNEALQIFAFLTLCVERTTELPLEPNTPVWRMAAKIADWFFPLRIRCRRYQVPAGLALWNTPTWDEVLFDEQPGATTVTETPMRPVSLSQLDALDAAWRNERDETVSRYGCQGFDHFFIYPAPEETSTALKVTYAAQPAALTQDADIPEAPTEDHPALISGALALLPLAFGGSELAQFDGEWKSFLEAAIRRAAYVRARSRSLQYDTEPAQIKLADMSRKPRGKK